MASTPLSYPSHNARMEVDRNLSVLNESFEGLCEFRVTRDFVLV